MHAILHKMKDRLRLYARVGPAGDRLCIGLWHEFRKPPYGGGNQFMLALEAELERQGVTAVRNIMSPRVNVHICNSAWFDVELFERHAAWHPVRMIHRIDGPVCLYRGQGREEDDKIHALNARFASVTVYQSGYCRKMSEELGYRAVKPTVVHNAVDSTIFHPRNRKPSRPDRKTRLISSAWSDNPRKGGGALLKWLDENLDWTRFEFTFVGRVQQRFANIQHIPPQDSHSLAELLRRHDAFVSTSQREPCSNALLEALSCGLPALYRNDGGNPELVKGGGVPFRDESDILQKLERLVREYGQYRAAIDVGSINEVAERYIQLARDLMH